MKQTTCLIAALCIFVTCSHSVEVFAQQATEFPTIVVTDSDSHEERKLELPYGQTADIIVYLASLGDPLEKYLVILRRDTDNSRVSTLLSDIHGRVKFKSIPPGSYRVSISKRVKEDGDMSTVKIGDVRLYAAPPVFNRGDGAE